jgi:hypothetical protein
MHVAQKSRLFSFGNTKLPKNIAIFNMSPASLCISNQLGLCQLNNPKKCYALKAERMYKQVLPYRMRQMEFWKKSTPDEFVAVLLKESGKRGIKFLRFNEAGDFADQADISKANEIAIRLAVTNIGTYCYTARKDLDFSNATGLVVNGSGFIVDNNFMVGYNNAELDKCIGPKNSFVCVQDCSICHLCTKKRKNVIMVRLH